MNPLLRKQFDEIFGVQPEPERPIDPPESQPLSLDVAEQRLRKSLTLLDRSEYFDEFAINLFDEITDAEADKVVVALLEGESLVVYEVMQAVKERAIRATAQQYIEQLGGVA
jgi:hypothetical protein